jgi:hypothetical protein
LVYINGDTALPGCATCNHRIDIQQFVTSVSVDCGVEPGAASASLSLSIPRTYGDSLFRDGNSLLRPGLEVQIYFRGYFPLQGMVSEQGVVAGVRLDDVPQYPYYPAFHGVVTEFNNEFSGGFFSGSLTCSGMLHFWQYFKHSSSGSYFGARPNNSRVHTTLTGHPFSGMTPYSIIYNLYRDTTGAAAGVGFALQSRTNFGARSSTTRESLYSLTQRYWERRFRERPYGLRMHGASGQLFTTSQQAYLSLYRTSSQAGRFLSANLNPRTARSSRDVFAQDQALLLGLADRQDGRVLRQPDLGLLPSANGGRLGLSATQMQAFVTDIGQFGQVNLFESTYESKLDIATQVTQVCGYEFYQDVDGDLVFKPPLYNLDTRSSRVYRLEPEDIISFSSKEAEPEATYVVVKAGNFQNLRGAVDDAEWGARSVYVNYPLVAQFGWREHSFETQYYNNAKSAFYAGVAQLDRINAGVNSATVTIPLRPEIRPGFPVYVAHKDCYYYVQSLSHSLSFGADATTTLNLVARRRKFMAPGVPTVPGIRGVDLRAAHLPAKPLQALSPEGLPRLVGFPNVVMALDPTQINPMFYVYGFQAEEALLTTNRTETNRINREVFLGNFLRVLWERGLIAARGGSSSGDFLSNPDQEWTVSADAFRDVVLTWGSLRQAVGDFIALREQVRATLPSLERRLTELRRTTGNEAEIQRITGILQSLRANFESGQGGEDFASVRQRVVDTLEILRAQSASAPPGRRPRRAPPQTSTPADPQQVILFTYLIGQIRVQSPAAGTRDMAYDPTGSFNESANILDLLNDRKASLGLNTPGVYRYYSSAHPDPVHQGYEPLDLRENVATTPETTTSGSGSETSTGASAAAGTPGGPAPTPSLTGRVRAQITPMTGQEAARYLREAYIAHRGSPPSDAVLAVLLAQWGLESGRGRHMYNFNYGGVKTGRHWEGGRVLLGTTEGSASQGNFIRTEAYFRAYGSAQEGAYDYLRNLLRNHAEALRQVETTGDSGRYVEALERSNYFTGDVADYVRNIRGLTRQALRDWVPAATGSTSASSETSDSSGSSTSQTSTERSVEIPSEEFRTVVLNAASNTEGIPSATAETLVQSSQHIPQAGLRVRTFTSSTARVVPTQQIRTLTFEQRTVNRASTRPTLVFRDGVTPTTAAAYFRSCLAGNAALSAALSAEWARYVGAPGLTLQRSGTALMEAALAGIQNVLDSQGSPLNSANWARGIPLADVGAMAWVANREDALRQLRTRAAVLIADVTAGHSATLQYLSETLRGLPSSSRNRALPPDVERRFNAWRSALGALFRGRGLPTTLPFQMASATNVQTASTPSFSPVFPISDERGYEHYGAYQYGRGLSIESGGNYERLMAQDPFQFADSSAVDQFVRALFRSRVRDSNGNLALNENVTRALREIAGNAQFQQSIGGQIALRWAENEGSNQDRTTMIATGLANYVLSDRDSVTKMTAQNAAYSLAELSPRNREEICACRGAEADLLMAAYMAGTRSDTFIHVEGAADQATTWMKDQIVQAGAGWSLAQAALRGLDEDQGRGSLLDQVEGFTALAQQSRGAASAAASEIENAVNTGTSRIDRLTSTL